MADVTGKGYLVGTTTHQQKGSEQEETKDEEPSLLLRKKQSTTATSDLIESSKQMQRSLTALRVAARFTPTSCCVNNGLSPTATVVMHCRPSGLTTEYGSERQSSSPQQQPFRGQSVRFIHQHTSEKRRLKKKKQEDPFAVLGITYIAGKQEVAYSEVKRTFLQIAMKHHPDTTNADTEEEKEEHREIFVSARKAFENIVEGEGGMAVIRTEKDDMWEEDELNEWFQQESGGFDMPFMDVKTRREVSRVMNEIGGGLDRDGGMWTLARMVANDVDNGGDGASLLRLEAGNVRDREINGVLRRRRKR